MLMATVLRGDGRSVPGILREESHAPQPAGGAAPDLPDDAAARTIIRDDSAPLSEPLPDGRGSDRGTQPRGAVMAAIKVEPGKTRVGWVGTGVMGRWMCQHLMTKGYPATVYNRTKDKAQPLIGAGAAWADTPKAVAE